MTQKKSNHMEYLEECFDQLIGEYHYTQDENKKLLEYINKLVALCQKNCIEVPPITECDPIPF